MSNLILKVEKALTSDLSILTSSDGLNSHAGHPLSHFLSLGITETDLKKLERKGLARRGYKKLTMQSRTGKVYSKTEVRWILVERGN